MTDRPNIGELLQRLDRADTSEDVPLDVLDAIEEASRLLRVLDRIHEAMDGEEWNADTTGYIGDLLTGAGFPINPPGYYDETDEEA